MVVLGISAYYHDSSAVILENGIIKAAVQEERFTRLKHDKAFPKNAIIACLNITHLDINQIDAIVFYDKPFLKFERLLQTYMEEAPKGWWQFVRAMPAWLKEKLFIKDQLKKELKEIGDINWEKTKLHFSKHHLSHAASAFFPSPFQKAAILTVDGVGEWATASIALGKDNNITTLKEIHFPHSLGLLYSAFTYFLGFKVNSGEYKVMGLAPYGNRESDLVKQYTHKIKTHLIEIYDDGSFKLNQEYFAYATSFKMINESKFEQLFGLKTRKEESTLTKEHYSLAAALQIVTEEVIIKMAKEAKNITKAENLCLSGGVALNCVANGVLEELNFYENIFIQPAAGDAGGALGAALAYYYMAAKNERKIIFPDAMSYAYLGASFSNTEIERALANNNLMWNLFDDEGLIEFTKNSLLQNKVVGWFQGKMEYGPRALGNRSILGNPLHAETQSKLNLKVKKRESFRPFAPIMLKEEFQKYFGKNYDSPYMLMVHKILKEYRKDFEINSDNLTDLINKERSEIPAITHVDYSARIQTVTAESNKKIFDLLTAFKKETGIGVLVNTSFNVRSEPIVCTPQDAINCFLNTDIDILVLGNYVVEKA
ncbi:MAG: carbamoyltransferase N-terminal domain-containing protein [Chitinophagales bacterium]